MPLGTFPSYGHQSRNAALRRETAAINSAATHRHFRDIHLRREIILYNWMVDFRSLLSPTNDAGVEMFEIIDGKLGRIAKRLELGERVYYYRLGVVLEILFRITDQVPRARQLNREEHKELARQNAAILDIEEQFGQ